MSKTIISDCGRYRYTLSRGEGPRMGFVMLNPSTADATVDDPTIRRCLSFARREGFAGLEVVNLYALRATSPKALWAVNAAERIGPDNDTHLAAFAQRHRMAVLAWGSNAELDRAADVVGWFRHRGLQLFCLGKTQDGAPRHPLYIRGDAPLVAY